MKIKTALINKPEDESLTRKFIGVEDLAARWSISRSAIYGFKCGTHQLTRYRFGRSVKFLLTEVEHIEKAITNRRGA